MKRSEIQRDTKSVYEAINLSELGCSIMDDLQTIFTAIEDAGGDKNKVNNLARIGRYLTDDWANLFHSASLDLKRLESR